LNEEEEEGLGISEPRFEGEPSGGRQRPRIPEEVGSMRQEQLHELQPVPAKDNVKG
jgi:hypothetical protein